MRLHYNADNSYLLANEKEILKFKTDNKNVNFTTRFCLGSISNGFSVTESTELSLNGNVYGFLVCHSSIESSDIINIHDYLTTKKNRK